MLEISKVTLFTLCLAAALFGAGIERHLDQPAFHEDHTRLEARVQEQTWNAAIECLYKHKTITWRGCE